MVDVYIIYGREKKTSRAVISAGGGGKGHLGPSDLRVSSLWINRRSATSALSLSGGKKSLSYRCIYTEICLRARRASIPSIHPRRRLSIFASRYTLSLTHALFFRAPTSLALRPPPYITLSCFLCAELLSAVRRTTLPCSLAHPVAAASVSSTREREEETSDSLKIQPKERSPYTRA